ncbi:nuclear transport factor 2 family protein [Mycobacterium sp. IDR2000157661]|nr:nuclear transport factor 2 family protein [Mycobacterium sp. IDR2000157661]
MTLGAADRLAVADLVHLYASAVDDRRFEDVVQLFTETAELRLPDPPRSLEPVRRHHGREGVRAAMAGLAAMSGVARTEHAIVGEVYAACDEPNYALGRITCIAHHWTISGGVDQGRATDLVWHLRYDDEYLRTRAGWRIHGRKLTINAIETRPVHRLRLPQADGRAGAADPSTASTEPAPRETRPGGRFRDTP